MKRMTALAAFGVIAAHGAAYLPAWAQCNAWTSPFDVPTQIDGTIHAATVASEARDFSAAGMGEIPTGDELRQLRARAVEVVGRDAVDAVVEAGAERPPCCSVPVRGAI